MKLEADVGRRLREARERAGPSQGQIAEMLQVSKAAICNWEQGLNIPPARLEQMADTYGVSAHWVRTGEADPSVAGELPKIVAMLEESSLNAEGKARIMVIAESSAGKP